MEQDNRNQINGENISNASAGGTSRNRILRAVRTCIQSKQVRERSRIACIITVI